MIAVLDTNVVMAGLFWKREGFRCLVEFAVRSYVLAVTPMILDEYERSAFDLKLREGLTANPRPWLDFIRAKARVVEPLALNQPACRDPEDDMFLECALGGAAQYLVSRDSDLLALEKPFGIEIVTPRKFLSLLKK